MDLKHIDIANLTVSAANMRAKGKTPDLTNILPSVRACGVLVPLIVRLNGTPDSLPSRTRARFLVRCCTRQ